MTAKTQRLGLRRRPNRPAVAALRKAGTMISLGSMFIIFGPARAFVPTAGPPIRPYFTKFRSTGGIRRTDVHLCSIPPEKKDDGDRSRRNFLGKSSVAASVLLSLSGLPSASTAAAASSIASTSASGAATAATASATDWPLGRIAFSLLPLAGTYTSRLTVQTTIVPDKIWTLDQVQGVVNVNVPVRTTVVALKGGGLWVHNPVAPTPQMLRMISELERRHGPVRHIVLGTVALEHKGTFGPFAMNYPEATVWIQPGQWSFPVDVPLEFLGVTQRGRRLRMLPDPATGKVYDKQYSYWNEKGGMPSWIDEIEYETLGPLKFKSVGAYSESVFYHKDTKSLIVTDCVVKVTENPPAVIDADPRAMLFHARDSASEIVEDTIENRKKGWRRMVQFGLVFFPSKIDVSSPLGALSDARKMDPSMRTLGEGAVPLNLYPWSWHSDEKNFAAIVGGGKLFCPPILTKLILDREPAATLAFVDRVCTRFPSFKRVIPCHLDNDVKAGPKEFRKAFEVLTNDPMNGRLISQRPLPEDLALLQKASDLLTDFGVVADSLVCDAEPARTVGRFASKSSKQ